jgi:pullulanase
MSKINVYCVFILLLNLYHPLHTMAQNREDFSKYPVYGGKDLGLRYTPAFSVFKIWSPTAEKATLLLYTVSSGGNSTSSYEMKKGESGTWEMKVLGNKKGLYYTFKVQINGKWSREVPDPYVKAVGVNGLRGMIVDESETNPTNWQNDKSPEFYHPTDAVIYELHVRDASISSTSGIKNKGKYVGLTEKGTVTSGGLSTGLDHIKKLGITHIHLLPVFDFFSVDESKPDSPQYNWGYDPLHYNVPEGSYATNANDGISRIKEFKSLVKTLHQNGLRVVMDVVYNHTMFAEKSTLNELVPNYYYRQATDGGFSNASACGNETASERPMMRKFMLESLEYWVKTYHIDGFRFDLMGIHDIETMNLIAERLKKIKPSILLYGEGWLAGKSPLAEPLRAVKKNVASLHDIAVFSDDVRDGIKGSVFENEDRGFASGKKGVEESVKFGIVASTQHPQINYAKINYSEASYATRPSQVITYCECHDNHVLWDKLKISCPEASEAQRKEMHKLALSIVLTSQGISFLHAGTEFLRTKNGVENSFNSKDSVNAIDWHLKDLNKDVFLYVKALIDMRKSHPAFRLKTTASIVKNLKFVSSTNQLITYRINGLAVGDRWKKIFVAFNGSNENVKLALPAGKWKPFIFNNAVSKSTAVKDSLKSFSAAIYYQE